MLLGLPTLEDFDNAELAFLEWAKLNCIQNGSATFREAVKTFKLTVVNPTILVELDQNYSTEYSPIIVFVSDKYNVLVGQQKLRRALTQNCPSINVILLNL